MKKVFLTTLILFTYVACGYAQEDTEASTSEHKKEVAKAAPPKEETVVTSHSIRIGGVDVPYKATVGTQLLNDDKGDPKASIFYVAYTRDNVGAMRQRPITFCFNGGPGSSSVWLHMGMLGPKRVDMNEQGEQPLMPFGYSDNPYSLLDVTDLVFIDPVSTGYSRAVPGEDPKQFHTVEKDVESVASFIRLYTTRNGRWESPKYIVGESYGTTRAAALALQLHDNQGLYLNGVILVSSVLNYQTISFNNGNDLPYVLFLPSYTAAALYHKKLSEPLQNDFQKTLQESEAFAYGEFAHALLQGDHLSAEEKKAVAEKLSLYTGISVDYIDRANLRLHMWRFAKELLRGERRTLGRFDSRQKGIDSELCSDSVLFDPSLENMMGVFTATFNEYVRNELGWKKDDEYKVLAEVHPWDFGSAKNQYLDVASKLRDVMTKNTKLRTFVASGYWDLATPYNATDYTFAHLDLDPSLRSNVISKTYEGGHMIYLYYPSLVKLKKDLAEFYK